MKHAKEFFKSTYVKVFYKIWYLSKYFKVKINKYRCSNKITEKSTYKVDEQAVSISKHENETVSNCEMETSQTYGR